MEAMKSGEWWHGRRICVGVIVIRCHPVSPGSVILSRLASGQVSGPGGMRNDGESGAMPVRHDGGPVKKGWTTWMSCLLSSHQCIAGIPGAQSCDWAAFHGTTSSGILVCLCWYAHSGLSLALSHSGQCSNISTCRRKPSTDSGCPFHGV